MTISVNRAPAWRFQVTPMLVQSAIVVAVLGSTLAIAPALAERREHGLLILLAYTGSLLAVRVLPWSDRPRVFRFLEDAVFGAWMGSIYVVACAISLGLAGSSTLDSWLSRVDQQLYGGPASPALLVLFHGPTWQEAFHLLYFSYYPLVVAAMLSGHLGRGRDLAPRPSSVVTAVFFTCCLSYLFLPAGGPLHAHDQLFPEGGPFTALVEWVFAMVPAHGGGAFPSSHVAVGLACVFVLARRSVPAGIVAAIAFGGMCVSTVYCSFHYTLDVPAGIGVGAAVVVAVEVATRRGPRLALLRHRLHARWSALWHRAR